MNIYIRGYAFEQNYPVHISTEYHIPDFLKNDMEIYAYLQMVFEKTGWIKYLFTFDHLDEEE